MGLEWQFGLALIERYLHFGSLDGREGLEPIFVGIWVCYVVFGCCFGSENVVSDLISGKGMGKSR